MADGTVNQPALNFLSGSGSKTVAATTQTTLETLTFNGVWVLVSVMGLNKSGNSAYNHIVGSRTVRTVETNGGGSMNAVLVNSTSVGIGVYHNISGGCTVNYSWFAFRIG